MKNRRWIWSGFLLTIYLVLEGIFFLGLKVIEKRSNIHYDPVPSELPETPKSILKKYVERKRAGRIELEPDIGWVNTYQANSGGMRDDCDYELNPPQDTTRIAAFGDSFTYSSDVELCDSWSKQLSELNFAFEVLNYGCGAYGMDQAYLRYLKSGKEYNPKIVFIGFMSENIGRHVNVFRLFYSRIYQYNIFTKPRFKIENGELVLLKNPLPTLQDYENFLENDTEVLASLGANDYYYKIGYHKQTIDFLPSVRFAKIFRYRLNKRVFNPIFNWDGIYNVNSEAYQVTIKIMDAFYKKVLENGAMPVIIIFPDTGDQARSRGKKECRYSPLLNHLQKKEYYSIDLLNALVPHESRYSVDDLVVQWGHFSPVGNEIIANYMNDQLLKWEFYNQLKLKEIIKKEQSRLSIRKWSTQKDQ